MLRFASRPICELLPDEAAFTDAFATLPAERKAKCLAFRFASDRFRSVAVWLLLRGLLREQGLDADALAVDVTETGKPFFRDCPGLHFSLSHAHGRVMAAVSDRPVGCDVERIAAYSPELADACLTLDERAALSRELEPSARNRHFTRLWVRKESVIKLRGGGVGCDPRTFSVLGDDLPGGLELQDFDFGDGHLGGLAIFSVAQFEIGSIP